MAALELPQPTPARVRQQAEAFQDEDNTGLPARALERLFRLYPANTDKAEVLLKVAALNALYSTNIFDMVGLARHITERNIDDLLAAGDPGAVARISPAPLGKDKVLRSVLSFATKYCSFHNPEAYPILDTYVEQVLLAYRTRDAFAEFRAEDLRDFPKFKRIIGAFRSHYGLTALPLRAVDRYLWVLGRALVGQTGTSGDSPARVKEADSA